MRILLLIRPDAHCTVYIQLFTLYTVRSTMYNIHCAARFNYTTDCTLYTVDGKTKTCLCIFWFLQICICIILIVQLYKGEYLKRYLIYPCHPIQLNTFIHKLNDNSYSRVWTSIWRNTTIIIIHLIPWSLRCSSRLRFYSEITWQS